MTRQSCSQLGFDLRPLPSWCLLAACSLSCRPPAPIAQTDIVVVATEYAFQVPSEIPAGTIALRLDNRGRVPHEMAVGQLRAGVSTDSMLAYVRQGHDPGDLADGVVGILIARPGQRSMGTLTVPLVQGRTYMLICQFKDADSLPPHIAMGMQASFVAK